MIKLYPDQAAAVHYAETHFSSGHDRLAIVSPTGTGKSYVALGLMAAFPGAVFVAPQEEILDGLRLKGANPDLLWTIKKLKNRLSEGLDLEVPAIIIDEAHHVVDNTHQAVIASIPDEVWKLGLTATFYRGTPKSSAELREYWGDPYVALTWAQAAQQKRINLPMFLTEPLVDDDIFEVNGGDFTITRVTSEYTAKSDDAASLILRHNLHKQPLIVGVNSKDSGVEMMAAIERVCGLQSYMITAETPDKIRTRYINDALQCKGVLIHINVISEGVDHPFRNYLDLSPTLSPRLFVQRAGRIMRPGDVLPKYICTNRNIERHSYLFDGAIPESSIIQSQTAFEVPSTRNVRRALGLESLGRIKCEYVSSLNGLRVGVYHIQQLAADKRTQFMCILHPAKQEPIWLSRTGSDAYTYDPWQACSMPTDLSGFSSTSGASMSPGQKKWFENQAKTYGIDPNQPMNARKFQLFPALKDIGYSL